MGSNIGRCKQIALQHRGTICIVNKRSARNRWTDCIKECSDYVTEESSWYRTVTMSKIDIIWEGEDVRHVWSWGGNLKISSRMLLIQEEGAWHRIQTSGRSTKCILNIFRRFEYFIDYKEHSFLKTQCDISSMIIFSTFFKSPSQLSAENTIGLFQLCVDNASSIIQFFLGNSNGLIQLFVDNEVNLILRL